MDNDTQIFENAGTPFDDWDLTKDQAEDEGFKRLLQAIADLGAVEITHKYSQ